MNITIKIDDESRFKDFVDKEIAEFTPEERKQIVKDALVAYLSDEKKVKELFYTEKTDNWGYKKTERTEFFNTLVPNTSDLTPELDIVRERMREVLCNDEAVKQLIKETWMDNLAGSLANNLYNSYTIRNMVQTVLQEMHQQQQI